jgi:hypothetical protein
MNTKFRCSAATAMAQVGKERSSNEKMNFMDRPYDFLLVKIGVFEVVVVILKRYFQYS